MSHHGFDAPTEKLRILIAPNEIDANASCRGYPEFSPSARCPYPGWCLEVISVLLRAGNIPHEFIIDRNNTEYIDWGRIQARQNSELIVHIVNHIERTHEDNQFSGIFGRIESGEVDMVCGFFQKSVLRMAHFDFSIAVADMRPTFITREIPTTFWSLLVNCLRPYDTYVWIGMLVALLAQMILWTVIGRAEVEVGVRPPRGNGQYFVWDVIEDIFNGGDHEFHFITGKLARLILFVFQKGLLLGLYSSLILTMLLTPPNHAPIKSQADVVSLVKSGQYKLITDKSRWFAQEIADSNEKLFVDLREATMNNPTVEPISYEHAMRLVDQGGYIYQQQSDNALMLKVAGKCYTFVYTQGLPFRSSHFLFRKGSPWQHVINKQIMRNYPFIDQVFKRYFETTKQTQDKVENRLGLNIQPNCPPGIFDTNRPTDPLDFWSVSGIFVLGAAGLITATIFFIIELASSYASMLYRALKNIFIRIVRLFFKTTDPQGADEIKCNKTVVK